MSGGTFCRGLCARGTPSDSDQVLLLIRESDWACVSLHVEILLHGAPPLCTCMRNHLRAASYPHPLLLPPKEWSLAFLMFACPWTTKLWTSCFLSSVDMTWCVCHNEPQICILYNSSWLSHSFSASIFSLRTHFSLPVSALNAIPSPFLTVLHLALLIPPILTINCFFLFLHSVLWGFSFSAIISVSLLLKQPLHC